MESEDTEAFINKTSNVLINALQNQTASHDEIFCILMHLSPFLGRFLPFDSEMSPSESMGSQTSVRRSKNEQVLAQKYQTLENFRSLTWMLASHYNTKIKATFAASIHTSMEESNCLSPASRWYITTCIQRIQVLIGERQAEEKYRASVSSHMDDLRQHQLTSDANVLSNLPQTKADFVRLSADTTVLVRDVVGMLLRGKVFKEKFQVLEFVQDTILEKLTYGLLSLSDSVGTLKTQSYKTKSPATSNKKTEHFSSAVSHDDSHLSDDLLTGFTDVVELFLKLEAYLKSPDIMQMMDYSSTGKSKKGVLKPHPFNLPDLIQSSHHNMSFSKMPTSPRHWNWHECLKDIAPFLSGSLANSIQEITQVSLEEAKEKYKSTFQLEMLPAASQGLPGMCHPHKSIKCVALTLQQTLKLLPLAALGGQSKHLVKLQSDFLDAVNQSLKNFKQYLTTVTDDIPEKASPENLATVLATGCDILTVLHHCAAKMQHDNRLPFHGALQIYKSLCSQMLQQLIQYHKSKLTTQLLHDPDSHHWSDMRAFYEGERCSYAIEMWHSYIKALVADLRDKLHCGMVREITCELVSEAIKLLADRYCNCHPSHNRSHQVWLDVQGILMCFYDLMWDMFDDPSEICPKAKISESRRCLVTKLHSALTDLFVCGITVASPTEELHDVLRQLDLDDFGKMKPIQWLPYINPTLFPPNWDGCLESLSNEAEVILYLKAMQTQRDKWLQNTLHALTTRNCHLAMSLATGKIDIHSCKMPKLQSSILAALGESTTVPDVMFATVKSMPAFSKSSFLNLEFLNSSNSSKLQPWQSYVKNRVMPVVLDALTSAIGFLSSHAWSAMTKAVVEKLPSNFRSMIPNADIKDKESLKHISLCLVLKALQAQAYSMPSNLVHFFKQVDDHLNAPSTLQCQSYWCHIMLNASRSALLDFQYWTDALGIDVETAMGSELNGLATLLVGLNQFNEMINERYAVAGIGVSDVIDTFRQTLTNIADQTVEMDRALSHKQTPLRIATEQDLTTEEIHALTYVHGVLCENFDGIAKQWNINITPMNCNASGGSYLDHASMANTKPDWEELLIHSFMSVNGDVLQHFMGHRADMQPNAHLDDQQRDWVHYIKQQYLNQT